MNGLENSSRIFHVLSRKCDRFHGLGARIGWNPDRNGECFSNTSRGAVKDFRGLKSYKYRYISLLSINPSRVRTRARAMRARVREGVVGKISWRNSPGMVPSWQSGQGEACGNSHPIKQSLFCGSEDQNRHFPKSCPHSLQCHFGESSLTQQPPSTTRPESRSCSSLSSYSTRP